jgi:hypothetical protein
MSDCGISKNILPKKNTIPKALIATLQNGEQMIMISKNRYELGTDCSVFF